jgi:hypothetical protein
MDPITLFALANGAVAAVKKGCQLYKDIKGAAGDIRGVLKDLDEQFHNNHKDKPATTTQRNAYIEEKNRVIELNKHDGDTTSIYTEIGNHLGTYYDNLNKCIAVFEEEERKARTKIYEGDDSLGKRALQRVLMRKQLEQMAVELRELMVYQSPPELGALYTEVEEMMVQMGKEQKILITKQIQREEIENRRRNVRKKQMVHQAMIGIAILFVIFVFGFSMMWVAQMRQEMYPQYGNEFIPKTEEQRRQESQPQIYVGR